MDLTYTINLSTPVAVAGVAFLISLVGAIAYIVKPAVRP